MYELLHYLNAYYPVSPEVQHILARFLKKKVVRKKQVLLHKGEIADKISYIETGLMQVAYDIGSKETTLWYNRENEIVLSAQSFFYQQPSQLTIKAVEQSLLWYLYYDDLMYVYKQYTDFNIIGRKLLEEFYSRSEQHLILMTMAPKDRYGAVIQMYPWLQEDKRIKDYMLAAYINVDRTTLSRYHHQLDDSFSE